MSLYAAMMKLRVDKARVRARSNFWGEGSVRAETVRTECSGVETCLEIESPEDPAQIAKLARLAEAGCYVIQSLRNPTPVSLEVSLNSRKLDVADAKA